MRGGERVLEGLCRLLPDADIFTLFYNPHNVSPLIRSHRVIASFLNQLRGVYRSLLPLAPFALEQFDLREYDLVISSESGPAKGVLVSSGTRHICYCHTPMRYLWDLTHAYSHDWTRSRLKRTCIALFGSYLRLWDYASAARVDEFVANSANVQRRIWRSYRRQSSIIYPPVNVECFYSLPAEDYYLVVSELSPYKRTADAVRYFSRTGKKLKVVGDGPEYRDLRRLAKFNVEFCGRVPEAQLRELYARSQALIFPGEEDFGITPVESLASGKPVIALGRGGVLESVPAANPRGGFFYENPDPDELGGAVERFEQEAHRIDSAWLQKWASQFSTQRFEREMTRHLLPAKDSCKRPDAVAVYH